MLRAISHFNSGINSVTSILPHLDSGICQVVYMSAVLICFVYIGRGPQPGEYLVFSEAGRSEFVVLHEVQESDSSLTVSGNLRKQNKSTELDKRKHQPSQYSLQSSLRNLFISRNLTA